MRHRFSLKNIISLDRKLVSYRLSHNNLKY
jgi:hypothetical protein